MKLRSQTRKDKRFSLNIEMTFEEFRIISELVDVGEAFYEKLGYFMIDVSEEDVKKISDNFGELIDLMDSIPDNYEDNSL